MYEPTSLYTPATATESPCEPPISTNIVIDDALMRQAMQASGARSKREAVELGWLTDTSQLRDSRDSQLRSVTVG